MRYHAYTIGPYVIRITGISHVATLNGLEVAYSQSRAGMVRMLKAHKAGNQIAKDRDCSGEVTGWVRGAFAQ